MLPVLLLIGGGALVYFYLRPSDAAAATTPAAPSTEPATSQSAPQPAPGQIPKPSPPTSAPSKPPVPSPSGPPKISSPVGHPITIGELAPAKPSQPLVFPGKWGWPVPKWQGRSPVISDRFGSPRHAGPHMGVDIMFARLASDPFPIGSPNGTKNFVMPDAWMAVAAADGVLWSAGHSSRGFFVVVDHLKYATFYTHLDTLFVPQVKPPEKGVARAKVIDIKAGQPLGVIGANPEDRERIKHLHFEVWRGGPGQAIDPEPYMKAWQVFTPNDIAPFLPSLTRNARARRTGNEPDLVHVTDYWRTKPGRAARP